jgi:glycosyltransferase involved in cell wall biosynthesis
MNPQDGLDYLLRALGYLRHTLKRSDFHCILIGEGDSLEELKVMAKDLRLDECVTFTGFIPDDEMVRYLSTVDICLDPNPSSPLNDVSTWIKVMEYMALGKPVVSFDLKETRVSAGEAAVFVEANDEMAFAKMTAALMDDPAKRAAMAQVGRGRVERELGWHVTSQNLSHAYECLLQQTLSTVRQPEPVRSSGRRAS